MLITPLRVPNTMFKVIKRVVSLVVSTTFLTSSIGVPTSYAQVAAGTMPWMPSPGVRVSLSPEFTPAHLKGMVIHPDNALQFDFLIHRGDERLTQDQKQDEYKKLIKYFLASLAIPDEDQWVNLSPYEKTRIIKDDFGQTEMGRDLLAQDYILKQITASLIYPESNLGQKFWDKVYAQAQQQYGTTNIPVNTFNKVWIVPDEAVVYEHGNTVYVLKNHLKVMLEEDYLSLSKHAGITSAEPAQGKEVNKLGSQVVREIVLPALEKEVNTAKNFSMLRQVYSGMILATWYKRTLKESLLGKIYADKSKVKGVDQDPRSNQEIYQQYLKAFKKGVFNFIKEDVDKYSNETIPRKYFSGGFTRGFRGDGAMIVVKSLQSDQAMNVREEFDNKEDLARVSLTESRARTTSSRKIPVPFTFQGKAFKPAIQRKVPLTTFKEKSFPVPLVTKTATNPPADAAMTVTHVDVLKLAKASLPEPGPGELNSLQVSQQANLRNSKEGSDLSNAAIDVLRNRIMVMRKTLDDLLRNPEEVSLLVQKTFNLYHTVSLADQAQISLRRTPGGIDLNAANLNLQIKRDGRGVPLPVSRQDLEHINIDGLIPVIIDIKPAAALPIFFEMQNSAHPTSG
ncbi:MAG: hypothetical protein HY209_03955 [Candidatus Omnitrophica bacterium]|nr:hypothetical protein [Candidatus Omnitrophota bacterium]